MANFKVREDGKFGNSEGCNYGCCCHCKYAYTNPNWTACSEACHKVNYGSCLNCDHKPDYMLRQDEAFYEFKPKKTKKVFSKEKYKEVLKSYGYTEEEIIDQLSWNWVKACEGLTEEEMQEMGYITREEWMITVPIEE